jgi:hypothetical protein
MLNEIKFQIYLYTEIAQTRMGLNVEWYDAVVIPELF